MEAVLIGAGLVLALWGLLRARRRPAAEESPSGRRRRPRTVGGAGAEAAAALDPLQPADPRESALAVLRQPVSFEPEGWAGLMAASPTKQFRLGTIFGLGIGLVLSGMVMLAGHLVGAPAEVADPPAADRGEPGTGQTAEPSEPSDASGPGSGNGGQEPDDLAPDTGGGTVAEPAPSDPAPQPPAPQPPAQEIRFVIPQGQLPHQVGSRLAEQGLVPSQSAFIRRLVERKLDARIQTGTFTLRTDMTLDQVIDALTG